MGYLLHQRGISYKICHHYAKNSSSRAAAGLFNPVTGRKMVKTWLADTLFTFFHQFYKNLEETSQRKFFHEIPIYRPFRDMAELNDWQGKLKDPEYSPYLEKIISNQITPFTNDNDGGLLLKQSGYLDVNNFLQAVHEVCAEQIIFERFSEQNLHESGNAWEFNGCRYKNVIFTNGTEAISSIYFSWLPFRPVKGEVIKLSNEGKLPYIYNRGAFIIPKTNEWILGATYNHKDLSWVPTTDGKLSLLKIFDELMRIKYTVKSQWAGVRPASADRRPFVGRHPKHSNIYILNGFGSKGVSLAPYFANCLIHFMEENILLPKEVDIERYYKKFNG
mgnify:CR=1 FL=1